MITPQQPHWASSLAFRLLVGLLIVQVGIVAAELLGLTRLLGGVLDQEARSETAQLGRVIRQTARQQMLTGSVDTMQSTMDDLNQTEGISRILITDKVGRVAHATDRQLVGRLLDRNRDAECVVCHTGNRVKPSDASPRASA